MNDHLKSTNYFFFLRIFIYINPLLFAGVVYYLDFVDFKGVFESGIYTGVAKNWLNESNLNYIPDRLPVYPLFIFFVFKIFGVDNLNALLFVQGLLGSVTLFFLMKILDELGFSKSVFVLISVFFNLSIYFRFSLFLPNFIFIFFLTLFVYCLTIFFLKKSVKHFYLFCFIYFLLMLTRPIFSLSLILVVPFIIKMVFDLKKNKKYKFFLVSLLLFSYFSAIFVQSIRYYNYNKSFAYTTQTGHHLLFFVIPCLAKKYACGTVDNKVSSELMKRYKNEIENIPDISINERNEIKIRIGINYILKEMDYFKISISAFFSYVKTLFHTSIIEIYESFQIKGTQIEGQEFKSPIDRINFLLNHFYKDVTLMIWLISLVGVFIMRFFQLIGILLCFKKGPMQLYVITITMSFLSLILPTVGIGNPRYRSESEILLIILGAFGFLFLKKLNKNNIKKKNTH